MGSLAEMLNVMADKVQRQVNALQERDDFRREFLANISHDLRSPITSIRGYVETAILKNGTVSEHERLDHLNIVLEETKRLDRLIGQLLQLARLEARSLRPEVEPFAAGELVQDVLLKLRPRADERNVQLRAELSKDVPLVSADIGMIERVLSNLVENALEHTPEGGQIVVDGARIDGRIRIAVRDTGCGISAEDLPRVTERFFKGSGAKPAGGGTGLGLAIAARIVELHGSSLAIESRVGEGTTVSMSLPLAGAKEGSIV